jgi:hypothetical protein
MGRCESLGWGVIIALGVLAAAIILVFSFAFGYLRHVKITVDDASLTRMELVTTPTTALAYNLSLKLVIRNPNWAIAIKHDKPLDAAYSFDGQPFHQGFKSSAIATAIALYSCLRKIKLSVSMYNLAAIARYIPI